MGTVARPGVNEERKLNAMTGMRLLNLSLGSRRKETGIYNTRTEQDFTLSPSILNFLVG